MHNKKCKIYVTQIVRPLILFIYINIYIFIFTQRKEDPQMKTSLVPRVAFWDLTSLATVTKAMIPFTQHSSSLVSAAAGFQKSLLSPQLCVIVIPVSRPERNSPIRGCIFSFSTHTLQSYTVN